MCACVALDIVASANGTVGMLRAWVNTGFPVSSREIAEMMYLFSTRVADQQ